MEETMRIYASSVALGCALLTGPSIANAQETVIVQQPAPAVIRTDQTTTVRTTRPVARPAAPGAVVAREPTRRRVVTNTVVTKTYERPIYDVVPAPQVQVVAPAVPAILPAAGQALNVSGQFRCVAGCSVGLAPAFITQNGWDLNVVNEFGQSSRAWIDRPGHIWVANWNEGAIYSPDGMTIQFDNGAVWRRDVAVLVVPRAQPVE
jgi:hypothetical protein